jgi:hypothetical protein
MQDFQLRDAPQQGESEAHAGMCDGRPPEGRHARLPEGGRRSAGVHEDRHVGPARQLVPDGWLAGDVVPVDQISLNFSKIEYEYKPQKADGSLDSPVKTGTT